MIGEASTTKERLRLAAAECFGLRGYEGTSMAELADRIGVRKATLYSHYPSKESLLLDLFESAIASWMGAGVVAFEGDGPLIDRLLAHFEASLAWVESSPHEAAIVRVAATRVAGDLGRRLATRLDQLEVGWLTAIGHQFDRAVVRGEVAAASRDAVLMLIRVLADGLYAVAVLSPHVEPAPRVRLALVAPLLRQLFATSLPSS